MQFTLRIEPDPAKLLPEASDREIKKITVVAINRSMATARTRFARRTAQELNLPVGTIRDEIKIEKANFDKVSATLTIRRKPIRLIDYRGTRQIASGTSVLVSKSKGRERLKSTFIAKMKSGHVGVFERIRGAIGRFDTSSHPMKFVPEGELNRSPGKDRFIRNPGGRLREFIRVSNDSGRVGRLPIIERFGKTVVGHLANAPGVLQEEVGGLQEVLSRNILSQIDRFLGRRKVDRG